MHRKTGPATASQQALYRIFTVPESEDSTLGQIESEISQNLSGFLRQHIVAAERPLQDIEADFSASEIPENPTFVSDHAQFLMNKLVAHSVNTSSPSFIGHMTSALPYFQLALSKLMVGLNQNLVKIETSKAFTPLERQVLGMMHRLVYGFEQPFYANWMHSAEHSLGAICSGGTIANITALWVARNNQFKADGLFKGIAEDGFFAALDRYQYRGAAILVSERGHYSLKKAANILGIGQKNLVAIPTDENSRVRVDIMREKAQELAQRGIRVMAIVGVAGTTETGNIDPLHELADLAEELDTHLHVDAAWGGATLMSSTYSKLLDGIERADSVTVDAHKQLYVPMGCGLVVFKDPTAVASIKHHAEYILREGSKDLGCHTLEGSRPGMAMLLHSSLNIISRKGYQMLIDQSIERAHYFADLIRQQEDFELMSEPELCLLTYRYLPVEAKQALMVANQQQCEIINEKLNQLTLHIQKLQRENGKSFVSRTRLKLADYGEEPVTVFRVVLANPLTTNEILQEVLQEQRELVNTSSLYHSELLDYLAGLEKVAS